MASIGTQIAQNLGLDPNQELTDNTGIAERLKTMQGKKPNMPTIDASQIDKSSNVSVPTDNQSKSTSAFAKVMTTPDTQSQQAPNYDEFINSAMQNVPQEQKDIFSQFLSQDYFGGAIGKTYQDIVEKTLNTQINQADRRKETARLQEEAGLPELQSQFTATQGKYNTLEAAKNSRLVNETGASAGLLTKTQQSNRVSEIQRQYGLQVADNRIDEIALSGKINAATQLIDAKLDLKYGDLEAELDLYKSQLETLTPLFNAEMQKIGEQRQFALNQLSQQLTEQRATEKEFMVARATALKNAVDRGATSQQIAQIQDSTNLEQLAATGFTTSALEQAQLQTERLQQSNLASQIAQRDADTQKTLNEINSTGVSTKELSVVNDINLFLESGRVDKVFGLGNKIQRNIPNTEAYTGKAEFEQIKGQLALAARGELKGQGTISDFEGKMLADAQTSLRLGMSPEDAQYELTQVRGAIRTSSGLTAPILVTNPQTGEKATVVADQNGINNAISDGFIVEYQ